MEAKTLEALQGSIAKWEKRAAGEIAVPSVSACPLCSLFYEPHCNGCPVSENTGQDGCRGTPVSAYQDLIENEDDDASADQLRQVAMREVTFLRSLLPSAPSEGDEHG